MAVLRASNTTPEHDGFGFWIWCFGFVSDLGSRISDLPREGDPSAWHGPRCRAGAKSGTMTIKIRLKKRTPGGRPMAVSAPSTQPAEPREVEGNGTVPPLEAGDRLTRAEFERRYEAMPHLKKAELIEGEVYMPSPVRHGRHSHPHILLATWLGIYETYTAGVEAGDNGSVRLDLDNEPQPDGYLIIRPEHGGQVRISEDDYIEGRPSWSRKSRPAAPVTTWERSSTPTAETGCASTSSGGSWTARSTGS